jgi:transposase-like protein
MPRRSDEEKRRLLAEWEASGLSKSVFAKQRGVSPNSLYRWHKALHPAAFVEVLAARPAAPVFVLRVRGAVQLEVPAGFDAAELRRLVDALC